MFYDHNKNAEFFSKPIDDLHFCLILNEEADVFSCHLKKFEIFRKASAVVNCLF